MRDTLERGFQSIRRLRPRYGEAAHRIEEILASMRRLSGVANVPGITARAAYRQPRSSNANGLRWPVGRGALNFLPTFWRNRAAPKYRKPSVQC
jgi:hypothetical protein